MSINIYSQPAIQDRLNPSQTERSGQFTLWQILSTGAVGLLTVNLGYIGG